MSEIRAVVFDIGGVLEINPDLGFRAKWETRLGMDSGALDQRLEDLWKKGSLGLITESVVRSEVRNRLGLGRSDTEEFFGDLWQEYLGLPNLEMLEFMSTLRPRFRVGILSDSFVGARRRESERYRFPELCDVLVYSHEVGLLKPDPRIYTLTSARLGVLPHRILFVDDSPHKVGGALEAGWQAVLHKSNNETLCRLRGLLEPSLPVASIF